MMLVSIPLAKDQFFVKRPKGKPALPLEALRQYLVQAIELNISDKSKLNLTEVKGSYEDLWYVIGAAADARKIKETAVAIFKEFGVKAGEVNEFY